MKKNKLVTPLMLIVVFTSLVYAMISNRFLIYQDEFIGLASRIASAKYVLAQSAGKCVGNEAIKGGKYEVTSGASAQAIVKLENNLENAHCYPNPFNPNRDASHNSITFSRLTSRVKLKVFSMAGKLVYSTESDTPAGELVWDTRNNDGEKTASGVYIYLLENNNGQKKKGKLAIIR